MIRTLSLALFIGSLAPAATSQYYELRQRARIVVTLPSRPIKSDFVDRRVYREALRRYHSEVRRVLRAERRESRRLYYLRRGPAIIHRPSS